MWACSPGTQAAGVQESLAWLAKAQGASGSEQGWSKGSQENYPGEQGPWT